MAVINSIVLTHSLHKRVKEVSILTGGAQGVDNVQNVIKAEARGKRWRVHTRMKKNEDIMMDVEGTDEERADSEADRQRV